MGMLKQYMLVLQERCSDHLYGQMAIEWAVLNGIVKLSGDMESDIRTVMLNYDNIIECYKQGVAATSF